MDIEKLILAAQHHGEDGDSPDHEVGDLQDLLRACWTKMTPKARAEVFREFIDELDDWLREDADFVVVTNGTGGVRIKGHKELRAPKRRRKS